MGAQGAACGELSCRRVDASYDARLARLQRGAPASYSPESPGRTGRPLHAKPARPAASCRAAQPTNACAGPAPASQAGCSAGQAGQQACQAWPAGWQRSRELRGPPVMSPTSPNCSCSSLYF